MQPSHKHTHNLTFCQLSQPPTWPHGLQMPCEHLPSPTQTTVKSVAFPTDCAQPSTELISQLAGSFSLNMNRLTAKPHSLLWALFCSGGLSGSCPGCFLTCATHHRDIPVALLSTQKAFFSSFLLMCITFFACMCIYAPHVCIAC